MTSAVEKQLTGLLRGGPLSLAEMVSKLGLSRIDVNRALYGAPAGMFQKVSQSPPIWALGRTEVAAKASTSGGTLILLDTGGLPNVFLDLARVVVEDRSIVAVAPLDMNTNPRGLSQSTRDADREIVRAAVETGRFEVQRATEMVREFADIMLALRAGFWLEKQQFDVVLVAGRDTSNHALVNAITQLGLAKEVKIAKTDEEFRALLGIG